ncbi:hypothetical protein Hanom_Chr12g01141941 [Helianthus anomalus]
MYDEESDVITSSVSLNDEDKTIIITEQLIREVLNFPDDENSPTSFTEIMVMGCMLRMRYSGLHRKGGYDVMIDYQMCMLTALVWNKKYNFSRIVSHYMKKNITSCSKTWIYPRFVQMILDHAYPDLVKDEDNDLLVLHHIDNETLIISSRYHKI